MSSQVDIIESTRGNIRPAQFLRDLLKRWLDQEDPSPTLEALCQALRADREIIGGAKAARGLKEKFKNRRGL